MYYMQALYELFVLTDILACDSKSVFLSIASYNKNYPYELSGD